MVKTAIYKKIFAEIAAKENEANIITGDLIGQAAAMIGLLQGILMQLREHLLNTNQITITEEIEFFKFVKPQVLGKLIFYNEVYRIETTCPVSGGKMYRKYFSSQIKFLKRSHKAYSDPDFFRYYRSGRTDRDSELFVRGKLDSFTGIDSSYFEADPAFSTYYDNLLSRIIAHDLLYAYLLTRIDPQHALPEGFNDFPEEFQWTGTKNALIELIYALHVTGVISNGKIGIRKITTIFQWLFKTSLGDIHHAFHRMKDRAGNRTLFMDQLKDSLEQYMDKDL